MAEALFNHHAAGKAQAFSAGTQPASHINPTVVQAMREIAIDISPQHPKKLTPEMLDDADKVVTMGCEVESVCPAAFVPAEEWHLDDPEGKPIEKVREIRGEIETKVKKLIDQIKQERR
jgi:arsenate reductase